MRTCPRCQRTNPAVAVYCYYDGSNLSAPSTGAGTSLVDARLPHEFVFASGRRCHSYDDLVQACQDEWGAATELLRGGSFRQFFTSGGRLDLAKTADEAQSQADPDLALDTFLGKLPATKPRKPRLDLEPRHLRLEPIRRGEKRIVQLLVLNQGHGLLHGTISITEGSEWLRLLSADDRSSTAIKAALPSAQPNAAPGSYINIKTVREQVVRLEVDTRQLMAPQKYAARLAIVTNGGIVEVAVRLTVLAHPFPREPFQGAGSPRDMAVRMRGKPKLAVPLLESGEIARWFEANRWGYPVQGRVAPGMAAVQQFFECMGLARAPRVRLLETEAQHTCLHPASVAGQVILQSPDRKWVYAHVDSDVLWLKVATPVASGPQQATISYVVDSSLLDPNGVYDGVLQVIGNGGQKLTLRVRVDVRQRSGPLTRRLIQPFLTGALAGLLLRALVALPADLYARVWAAPAGSDAGSFASWGTAPVEAVFIKNFTLATWWLGAVIGAVMLARRGSSWIDVPFGIIAGAAAGVAGAATFACALPALDSLPRWLWQGLMAALGPGHGPESAGVATAAWLVLAIGCWTVMGAVAGFLLGRAAAWAALMERIGAPVA